MNRLRRGRCQVLRRLEWRDRAAARMDIGMEAWAGCLAAVCPRCPC